MKKILLLSVVLIVSMCAGVLLCSAQSGDPAVVYFTSDISPEGLVKVYQALGWEPTGKVAVKISTGEGERSNNLRPELIKDLVQSLDATIVECNTAYTGARAATAKHYQVAEDRGYTAIADFQILDEFGIWNCRFRMASVFKAIWSAHISRIMSPM